MYIILQMSLKHTVTAHITTVTKLSKRPEPQNKFHVHRGKGSGDTVTQIYLFAPKL